MSVEVTVCEVLIQSVQWFLTFRNYSVSERYFTFIYNESGSLFILRAVNNASNKLTNRSRTVQFRWTLHTSTYWTAKDVGIVSFIDMRSKNCEYGERSTLETFLQLTPGGCLRGEVPGATSSLEGRDSSRCLLNLLPPTTHLQPLVTTPISTRYLTSLNQGVIYLSFNDD